MAGAVDFGDKEVNGEVHLPLKDLEAGERIAGLNGPHRPQP